MVSDKASLAEQIFILVWMSFLGIFGIIKFILGLVYINGCPDIALLPWYLVFGGIISLVPPLLMTYRNIKRKESAAKAVDGLWWVLEKVLLFSLVLIVAGTIYILVTVTRVRVIGRLCNDPWLPPFGLSAMCLDWVCYIVFFCSFCNVEYKEPTPPVGGPMLPSYWHRHRHRHRHTQRPVRF